MTKLYRCATFPQHWVAYVSGTGWLIFPKTENGWNDRKPARGLDPMHLREVPVKLAENTGILEDELASVA